MIVMNLSFNILFELLFDLCPLAVSQEFWIILAGADACYEMVDIGLIVRIMICFGFIYFYPFATVELVQSGGQFGGLDPHLSTHW
jgi:hypothetical protein